MDPERPFESLARAHLSSPANPTIQGTLDYFVKAAKEYRVDGVINVVKRTCGLLPGMQRLTKEAIWDAVGVPSLIFDLDGVDSREYDAEATKAQLDSFVETLLARKGA
jgi:benzoyl-CoA reductase/2-hydroxyglutaryl-CoA dehydratase subunit BcrC/BadD/HgdB